MYIHVGYYDVWLQFIALTIALKALDHPAAACGAAQCVVPFVELIALTDLFELHFNKSAVF